MASLENDAPYLAPDWQVVSGVPGRWGLGFHLIRVLKCEWRDARIPMAMILPLNKSANQLGELFQIENGLWKLNMNSALNRA